MPKTANVFTRVDPGIKEQAEDVLNQLGISMSTAVGLFLQQVALQRGIPFEVKLPKTEPIAYEALTNEEFDNLMNGALKAYGNGECVSIEEFENDMRDELNL